jgi:methionine sulfoxide reductase heme-binding subunit
MKRFPITPLQAAAHIGAWLLLAWLAWDYLSGGLGVDPVQALTRRTGKYALVFLGLSLACTPLNSLFKLRQAIPARRPLGLYAFTFATLHLLTFVGLDFGFNWNFLLPEFVEKPYIWVGLSAFLILLALALTSSRWSMRTLGKNWKKLHRLVYVAGGLAVVHFAWASKGEVLRLSGDILQPLLFGVGFVVLMVLRIPLVKERAARLVSGFRLKLRQSEG